MFDLIEQHADFIVINKHANTSFHDDDNSIGVFNQVKQNLNLSLNLSELYPVHRLDKMTSGLMLLATNQKAATAFGELFSKHKIEKFYLALSDKKPKKKQGLIKGDMAKSRRGMWKLLRSQDKPAITQFFSYALPSDKTPSKAKGQRLYILKPHSGKTHQIRVALASIGAPIIGDPLYYPEIAKQNADRGYLHAYSLRFELFGKTYRYLLAPSQGQLFNSQALLNQLNELREPWQLNWPKR